MQNTQWSLPRSDIEEKDLGVWMDDRLKFSTHIGHAVANGNQVLGLIKRSFVCRDSHIIKQLFTAHVRPHLEYANAVCHPLFKKDIEQLERVQRRATTLVPGLSNMLYQNRLKAVKLPFLVYQRCRGDMIEVYKYLHGMYSVPYDSLLKKGLSLYQVASWSIQPSGHNSHGPKMGELCPIFGEGSWSPSETMWPGLRPTRMPSFILIRTTVWPQYTNVTDRTDNNRIA